MAVTAMRRVVQGAVLVALICASVAAPADAQQLNRLERHGKALLTKLCSQCHAVGLTGRSPHPGAPELRNITRRYEVDDLVAQLREGFTGPHPDMPTFHFSWQDAEAVQAYLHKIQQ